MIIFDIVNPMCCPPQVIEWMKNPTPVREINKFAPWSCQGAAKDVWLEKWEYGQGNNKFYRRSVWQEKQEYAMWLGNNKLYSICFIRFPNTGTHFLTTENTNTFVANFRFLHLNEKVHILDINCYSKFIMKQF